MKLRYPSQQVTSCQQDKALKWKVFVRAHWSPSSREHCLLWGAARAIRVWFMTAGVVGSDTHHSCKAAFSPFQGCKLMSFYRGSTCPHCCSSFFFSNCLFNKLIVSQHSFKHVSSYGVSLPNTFPNRSGLCREYSCLQHSENVSTEDLILLAS